MYKDFKDAARRLLIQYGDKKVQIPAVDKHLQLQTHDVGNRPIYHLSFNAHFYFASGRKRANLCTGADANLRSGVHWAMSMAKGGCEAFLGF